jgi:hypothetical protein
MATWIYKWFSSKKQEVKEEVKEDDMRSKYKLVLEELVGEKRERLIYQKNKPMCHTCRSAVNEESFESLVDITNKHFILIDLDTIINNWNYIKEQASGSYKCEITKQLKLIQALLNEYFEDKNLEDKNF